jgi:hypothetical protein
METPGTSLQEKRDEERIFDRSQIKHWRPHDICDDHAQKRGKSSR